MICNEKLVIGQNIDKIRKLRGWSKAELARRMETSANTITQNINSGTVSLELVFRYMKALGCEPNDIFAGTINREDFDPVVIIEDFYPYNLAIAVYQNENILNEMCFCYPRFEKAFEGLSERVQKVLGCRYKAHMTLEQTANEFGVTRERIRQIEHRGLRLLRHPARRFMFDADKLEEERLEALSERDRLELEVITLKDKLSKFPEAASAIMNEPEPEPEKSELDIPISEMELSVRSYNCLARAGFRTVKDLVGITARQLLKVRNLGRKSMVEIIEKLKEYGIEVREDE